MQQAVKSLQQALAIFLLSAVVALIVNQLRPHKLPWIGDWTLESQLALDSGDNLAISLAEAESFFYAEAALFLDARSALDFADGHIEGARSLPWEQFEALADEVLREVGPETIIITYCDGNSCNLSKELALALMDRGYVNVRVLVNGWTVWQERSLPTATGAGP